MQDIKYKEEIETKQQKYKELCALLSSRPRSLARPRSPSERVSISSLTPHTPDLLLCFDQMLRQSKTERGV